MAEESRNTYKIYDGGEIGQVEINDGVIAVIAAVAAMDVEGVSSMAGNVTAEIVSKLGMKKLSKGVKVEIEDHNVSVMVAINLDYGYNVIESSKKVQEKVKSSVENMTGMNVVNVNVKIASVNVQ